MTLKQIRQKIGWSQNQMAKFLGICQSEVSHFETGRRLPSFPVSVKILQLAKKNGIHFDLEKFID